MSNEDLYGNKAGPDFLASARFIGVVTILIVNSLITNQIIPEARQREERIQDGLIPPSLRILIRRSTGHG